MAAHPLRSQVSALVDLATTDLAVVWHGIEVPGDATEQLHDVLRPLLDTYAQAAAAVGADWYDEARDRAEVRGRFAAIVPDLGDLGAEALVGWAVSEASSAATLRTLVEGGTQRRIANGARAVVTGSSIADPAAVGWQRTGAGDCDFCAMLIGPGAVYTEATADFACHDHCQCGAEPDWSSPRTARRGLRSR